MSPLGQVLNVLNATDLRLILFTKPLAELRQTVPKVSTASALHLDDDLRVLKSENSSEILKVSRTYQWVLHAFMMFYDVLWCSMMSYDVLRCDTF